MEFTAADTRNGIIRTTTYCTGYCQEWRCGTCNGFLAGAGPVGCRCDGAPRYAMYPDMRPGYFKFHKSGKAAAVKPSQLKRAKGRR